MVRPRKPTRPTVQALDQFCAQFDDLFSRRSRPRSPPHYLIGLPLRREHNKTSLSWPRWCLAPIAAIERSVELCDERLTRRQIFMSSHAISFLRSARGRSSDQESQQLRDHSGQPGAIGPGCGMPGVFRRGDDVPVLLILQTADSVKFGA